MAEINIERKRGVSPLVWILLLIVLGAISWFVYSGYMDGSANRATAPAATTTRALEVAAAMRMA